MTSKPFERIAADSNVVLSAAVARAAARVFQRKDLEIVTTDANYEEVLKHLPALAEQYGLDEDEVAENLRALPLRVYPLAVYFRKVPEATRYLGKRDPKDVPLAALALELQIPIWSNDHDFEVLPGVPLYPTAKLLKVLGL